VSYSDPRETRDHGLLTLGLISTVLGAFAYFAFGPGFENEYAGFGALIALPMAVGALFTLQFGSYSPLGCLIAPIGLGLMCYGLVLIGAEGLICVVMIMPFWFIAGLGGGLIALFVLRKNRAQPDENDTKLRSVGIAAFPFLLIYLEGAAPAA